MDRCRGQAAPRGTRRRRSGSSGRRANGSRTSPTCSPTTFRQRSSSPVRPPDPIPSASKSGRSRFLALAGERARARRRSRRGASGEGARARSCRDTSSAPGCSSAGPRRRSSRAGCRTRGRRSRKHWPGTGKTETRWRAGRVLTALSTVLYQLGDPGETAAITEAIELLEAEPPGPSSSPPAPSWPGLSSCTLPIRRRLLRPITRLPSPSSSICPSKHERSFRGAARSYAGDPAGLEDMQRALRIAVAESQGRAAAVLYNNLADTTWLHEGPEAAIQLCPGRDRVLRAARHHRVRARDRCSGRLVPGRGRAHRGGVGRVRRASPTCCSPSATSRSSGPAPCSCVCAPSATRMITCPTSTRCSPPPARRNSTVHRDRHCRGRPAAARRGQAGRGARNHGRVRAGGHS